MKKIGIIDCGTNTFHLMIVQLNGQSFSIVKRLKTAVRIGAGGINKNIILEDGQTRALEALSRFKKILNEEGIVDSYAFATSAFRNATNGWAVKEKIKKEIDIDIQIIGGDREAELIYKGVNLALQLKNEIALVMDIGGGSVEFIIGSESNILWKKSFEIGGQRLLELFHKSDPIKKNNIQDLEMYLETQLTDLYKAIRKFQPTTLAGSSGTFDTLSEIYCVENNIHIDESDAELPLTFEAYYNIHGQLISMNRVDRLQIPGMIEMRVDMIVVASCLINYLITKHKFDKVRVSTYSLKEGFLAEYIN